MPPRRFDLQSRQKAEKKRLERLRRNLEIKLQQAEEEALRLSRDFIRIDPYITEIWFFGSAAKKNPRSLDFDIDLEIP